MLNVLVGTSLGHPFGGGGGRRRRRLRTSTFCFILLCGSGSVGVKVWALEFKMGFK